jgi:hypothetical protein
MPAHDQSHLAERVLRAHERLGLEGQQILVEGREESIPELFTEDFYSHAWSPMYGSGLGGAGGSSGSRRAP